LPKQSRCQACPTSFDIATFFSFIGVSPFSWLGRQGISAGDTLFLSQPQFSTRNVAAQDYPGQFKQRNSPQERRLQQHLSVLDRP
jgi:hypothetical protein